jgi:hypothetical protein
VFEDAIAGDKMGNLCMRAHLSRDCLKDLGQ